MSYSHSDQVDHTSHHRRILRLSTPQYDPRPDEQQGLRGWPSDEGWSPNVLLMQDL